MTLGSALDLEARERGNSVYLPDRVVPMLPEALSNGLCSLRPQEHRLCLVCDMQVSPLGKITSYRFYRALMFSAARLTYTQVAAFIDAGYQGFDGEVAESLRASARRLSGRCSPRAKNAARSTSMRREQKLILENGLLERIEPVVRNDAHRLIEEAMIAANVCAARFLEKHEAARAVSDSRRSDAGEVRHAAASARVTRAYGLATTPSPTTLQARRGDSWPIGRIAGCSRR